MNVEIGTEVPIFLFWEYLFQIFGILSLQCSTVEPGAYWTLAVDSSDCHFNLQSVKSTPNVWQLWAGKVTVELKNHFFRVDTISLFHNLLYLCSHVSSGVLLAVSSSFLVYSWTLCFFLQTLLHFFPLFLLMTLYCRLKRKGAGAYSPFRW